MYSCSSYRRGKESEYLNFLGSVLVEFCFRHMENAQCIGSEKGLILSGCKV